MGIYTLKCTACNKLFGWFSGHGYQDLCPECTPIFSTTNTTAPPEPPQGPRDELAEQIESVNWRQCPPHLKRDYDRVVQERDQLAITAARLFSDAGRLTEERDRLRLALEHCASYGPGSAVAQAALADVSRVGGGS